MDEFRAPLPVFARTTTGAWLLVRSRIAPPTTAARCPQYPAFGARFRGSYSGKHGGHARAGAGYPKRPGPISKSATLAGSSFLQPCFAAQSRPTPRLRRTHGLPRCARQAPSPQLPAMFSASTEPPRGRVFGADFGTGSVFTAFELRQRVGASPSPRIDRRGKEKPLCTPACSAQRQLPRGAAVVNKTTEE